MPAGAVAGADRGAARRTGRRASGGTTTPDCAGQPTGSLGRLEAATSRTGGRPHRIPGDREGRVGAESRRTSAQTGAGGNRLREARLGGAGNAAPVCRNGGAGAARG